MNWIKDKWNALPERIRAYALKVLAWLALVAVGYLVRYVTGQEIERVPFPVYVEVEKEAPIAEPVDKNIIIGLNPRDEFDAEVYGKIDESLRKQGFNPLHTGWKEDPAAVKAIADKLDFKVFSDTPAGQNEDPLPKAVYLWHAYRQITGQNPPAKNQNPVGSCVSFGTNNAIERTMAVQIALKKQSEKFKFICEEITYAGSRVEVGGGRIGGDGSIGAWAAKFVRDWGVIAREKVLNDKYDLTSYNPTRCRDWGRKGVPDDLEPLAREHPVKEITQVKSWDEAKRALANGYGIAICSNQGFSMSRDSRGIAFPRGSWAHCMCLDGFHVDDDGKEYGHIENSWGASAHSGPVGWGEPSTAGFWADSKTISRMLAQDDSWAFSAVKGFPAQRIDWTVMRFIPDDRQFVRAHEPEFALAP